MGLAGTSGWDLGSGLCGLVWTSIDTWAVVTAAIVGAACALPGCYLFLRKQSMMADALTHAVLPGVILAFLIAGWLESQGVVDQAGGFGVRQVLLLTGAMFAGLLTAWLSEWLGDSQWVRVDAALGTVFTTLFAVGLILLSRFANHADIDLDCVLYGNLEMVGYSNATIPGPAIASCGMLVLNVAAAIVLHKELAITTFDPQLSQVQGFRPEAMHFGLLAVTTATLVTAFEVVGSILVIGMLILPAATAFFITRRLPIMLAVAAVVAILAAGLGHVAAITIPAPLTRGLGLTEVRDVKTSGTIVLVSAVLLVGALVFGPERGLVARRVRRRRVFHRLPGHDQE